MAETRANELLLPEKLRRRLDSMTLVARSIRAGAMKGERRSVRRGTSIEFADYRNYTPGDDLRKLDWNVYARLERPYIKLLEDEEDLAVHILLDISASMDWPPENAPDNKFTFARRLMAGLAYTSLSTGDRLMLTALNDRGPVFFGPSRGRGQTVPMLQYLHGLKAAGVTELNSALRSYALREKRPGLLILISDLFSPNGHMEGLNALRGKGHEVLVLHLLSPEELSPPLAGDLRLIDVETGRAQEVSIDAGMRDLYQRRLEAWLEGIRLDCARRDVHYLQVRTDSTPERVLLYDLRRLGVIK